MSGKGQLVVPMLPMHKGETVKRTHRNAQQADNQLDRRKNVEQRSGLGVHLDEPLKGLQRQAEAEDVFEDDHAREALDGQVACGIVSSTFLTRLMGNGAYGRRRRYRESRQRRR